MNPLIGGNAAIGGIPCINMQTIQSMKRMMGMLNMAKNPQAALQMAAQQNPMLGNIMQMCQGKSPKDVFSEQCKQHGLDPDATMKQIQQMIG